MNRDEFLKLKDKHTRSVAVYDKIETTTDGTTGQVTEEKRSTVLKRSSEPDFIKIYYETMLAFNEISNIPTSFVLCLSKYLEWTNDGKPMCVTINKRVKEDMQKMCSVKIAQVNRYITTSVEKGLLFRTEYRGVYEANPFMIAKGRWESIKDLQCKFDYVNGKWTRKVVEESDDNPLTTEEEKSAM